MRRIWLWAAIATTLCSGQAVAQASPPNGAAEAIAQFDALCRADGGRLWGETLCGPLMLVDPKTREIVASQAGTGGALRPAGGLFVGTLPPEIGAANTAVAFDGITWTMVLAPLPQDEHARAALLMHEAWHRIQKTLGFAAASPAPAHLATPEGRTWLRMEWRALAAALAAPDEASRKQAVADALAFRQQRRGLASDAADLENQLELNEGLAEYTGAVLSGRRDPAATAVEQLSAAEHAESFVRSFAYTSGPAYGLLLDRTDPSWRVRLRGATEPRDLGRLLAQAAGVQPSPIEEARRRYAYEEVAADEARRHELHQQQASAWHAALVTGPTLRLPLKEMNISFNPQNLFPLPPEGTVYPTLRVADRWGVLQAEKGALIDDGWGSLTVAAPTAQTPDRISGPGWTLELAPGWRIDQAEPGRSVLAQVPPK
ncbi:hypothetical protein [Caulobacter sp. 17J65-9]|uniref:hypothetical protein n=1 Tax=Caulobacter sp. 17J65-9 TaxID=2709382 RepID=UPI0013CD8F28|nr:hypothetical protein [Caulobacter sp. 17J65-9]NEX92561.1 hypothetical protein [Caulobacter sp. 17J65-9]